MKLAELSRKKVLRQLFEAITVVGFQQWWQSELASGLSKPEAKEHERKAYFQMFKRAFWAEFQALTENTPIERLQDSLADWVQQGNVMSTPERIAQEVQRAGDELER